MNEAARNHSMRSPARKASADAYMPETTIVPATTLGSKCQASQVTAWAP
jgi:hypothetical protein